MSWVTIIWSMVASSCLTLAVLRFIVWSRNRAAWGNFFFAITTVGVACVGLCELAMMRAETAGQFHAALRWLHVPAWVVLVALIAFVRVQLRAGSRWLAWSACGVRTLSLALNFVVGPNLNYREASPLSSVPFMGESISFSHGAPNPWMLVGQLGLLLMVIFLAHAVFQIWRRGDRGPALVVGGSILVAMLVLCVHAVLILWRVLPPPMMSSVYYMLVVLAMAYQIGHEAREAALLIQGLKKKGEWLDLAADSAGVGLWSWDFKTDLIDATDRARDLYGLSGDEPVTLQKFLTTLHPADAGWVVDEARRCLREGVDFRHDYRVVTREGGTRWLRVLGKPFLTTAGGPGRMTGVSFDITDRKQVETRLRENEEQMRITNEAANLGVWSRDLERQEIWASEHWRTLFGFGKTERLELDAILQRVHPDDRRAVGETFAKALAGDERYEMEYRVILPDGGERWISSRGRVEFSGDGKPVLARGISLDITQRKQAELEIGAQRKELTYLSRVTILGELSGSIAHELNQPLAAMLSNAQVGRRSLDTANPDLKEMEAIFEDITADAKRAGGIIHGMRAMFKKDTPAALQPVDVNETVTDVINLLHSELVAQKVRVDLHLTEALPPVTAGRVEIQQVVINLVLNSLDAVKTSGVSCRIEVSTALEDGCVVVSVHDNGPGIPAEMMKRLFEPFASSKPSGLGLGLAISRRIADRFGAQLTAGNHSGGGAVFRMIFPRENA